MTQEGLAAVHRDGSGAQSLCFILFLFPVTMGTVKHCPQFDWILSVLLMGTFYMSQATFVQNIYRKLEPGQNITGQIVAKHKGISHIECSTL